MSYLLYSFLYAGALALSLPYLLYRSLREPGFGASVRERLLGREVNPSRSPSIWIHAVSVGEVLTAGILVPRLKEAYPGKRIAFSVTTPTGRKLAEEKLSGVDDLFYCPFDLAFLVRRMTARVRPEALLVIETEIWPNLLREARRAGAVTLLVNGRISDRSFPGYLRIRRFLRSYLAELDRFLMQEDAYAVRIAELGAPGSAIRVTGSLKFDAVANGSTRARTASRLTPEGRVVLVAGSTLEPEERVLLSVFERLRRAVPALFLVLAPRHVPRFGEVFELARSRGLEVARRSLRETVDSADVLVLDTLGELASLYGEADLVFVGGSLASWGGHNIIEPAALGKPVVFGPHMANFASVARAFLEAGAAVQVKDENELERALRDLLAKPERRHELSRRARKVVDENRGAASRSVAELRALLP